MIKVIVDTGVVVSAAFRDRTPEDVILFIVGEEDFEKARKLVKKIIISVSQFKIMIVEKWNN